MMQFINRALDLGLTMRVHDVEGPLTRRTTDRDALRLAIAGADDVAAVDFFNGPDCIGRLIYVMGEGVQDWSGNDLMRRIVGDE
jgi:hypothetical protein